MKSWNYHKAWEKQLTYMMYEDLVYLNDYTDKEKHYINLYLTLINDNDYNDVNNNIFRILQNYTLLDNIKDIVKNCNILLLFKNNKIIEIKETIINNIYELSIHNNTYTLILNLLDIVDFHQLIILKIDIYIIELIENKYGCIIVQKLIELVDDKKIINIIKKIFNYFPNGYKSSNANYVYQLIIKKYYNNNNDLIDCIYIYDNITTISMHQYGCRIICRIIEQKKNNVIINYIIKQFKYLIFHYYSRFVIESLIDNASVEQVNQIKNILTKDIIRYSINPHSSFIIRKLINNKSILINNVYKIRQIIFLLNHTNTYYISVYILNKLNKEIRNKIKHVLINNEYDHIQNNINYKMYLKLLNK